MVLWEITLGTAYFLGLKRTYRLALKIERRLVSPNHPKIRDFLHRRTRAIFDMALSVHRNVQQRDLEVGRNLGNWILRWLDRMKPAAEIRGNQPRKPPTGNGTTKHLSNSNNQSTGPNQRSNHTSAARKSDGRTFATSLIKSKTLPVLSMMMRPLNPFRTNIQYRQLSISGPDTPLGPGYGSGSFERVARNDILQWPGHTYGRGAFEGVIRKDIMQWMLRN
ncbi:hypothetical protein AQUCO_00500541v1 [Aquilegia coerulea]|uniref:Uncharacterized protein n=2 Tax=Aquilegia coerulea TaxID=218851 RepID=A0A2G5ESD7_AQUCA|nr:hypothetical protein AQUCO_00500541v1 [Aquilegia coerulea]